MGETGIQHGHKFGRKEWDYVTYTVWCHTSTYREGVSCSEPSVRQVVWWGYSRIKSLICWMYVSVFGEVWLGSNRMLGWERVQRKGSVNIGRRRWAMNDFWSESSNWWRICFVFGKRIGLWMRVNSRSKLICYMRVGVRQHQRTNWVWGLVIGA